MGGSRQCRQTWSNKSSCAPHPNNKLYGVCSLTKVNHTTTVRGTRGSCKLIRMRPAKGREAQRTVGKLADKRRGRRGCKALTLHRGPWPRMISRWALPLFSGPSRHGGGHCPPVGPVRVARRRSTRPYHIVGHVQDHSKNRAIQPKFIRMLLLRKMVNFFLLPAARLCAGRSNRARTGPGAWPHNLLRGGCISPEIDRHWPRARTRGGQASAP